MYKSLHESILRHLVADNLGSKTYIGFIREVFHSWADGQVQFDIVVTWQEYITLPALIQFELIHESTKCVIDVHYKYTDTPAKIVELDCLLQWPPLSMIKLLKFVCAFNLGQFSTRHMENLVADVITSSLSVTVYDINDIYTVFNMAAWCYVKIKKYQLAARMMAVAIGTSSETEVMNRCAFSHRFVAYVIAQCII